MRSLLSVKESVEEVSDAESFDWYRAVLGTVIEQVTVQPGRQGYDRLGASDGRYA
jgi:hypothetical protein